MTRLLAVAAVLFVSSSTAWGQDPRLKEADDLERRASEIDRETPKGQVALEAIELRQKAEALRDEVKSGKAPATTPGPIVVGGPTAYDDEDEGEDVTGGGRRGGFNGGVVLTGGGGFGGGNNYWGRPGGNVYRPYPSYGYPKPPNYQFRPYPSYGYPRLVPSYQFRPYPSYGFPRYGNGNRGGMRVGPVWIRF